MARKGQPKFELSMPNRFTDRLLSIKEALQQTIDRILDINRRKKVLAEDRSPDLKEKLDEELYLLNKLAENQATLIKRYQHQLKKHRKKSA